MHPVLEPNDLVVACTLCNIKKNDIVAFKYKGRILIKQVLGTEGDFVNTKTALVEYNPKNRHNYVLIEKDHFYLVGFNRSQSKDSRHFGNISKNDILGPVFLHLGNYSFKKVSLVKFLKFYL